jgi:hypothetical protein
LPPILSSFTDIGSGNFFAGPNAGNSTLSGFYNVGFGLNVLQANTSGGDNEGVGSASLYENTTGSGNSANGYYSLDLNVNGSQNTATGAFALQNNTHGNDNTANGYQALVTATTGSSNTALGYRAGANITTGGGNIDIGNAGSSSDANTIRIGSGQTDTYIAGTIHSPTVTSITIIGGSDLAEPFQISSPNHEIPEGSVVVIDKENPGHLKVSSQAYDTRVAGVVSGANGINSGIQMHQQGMLEGGRNVALSGRVYVQADASNDPIEPGDLLTTSATPGHAMKVKNHAKAQGAILGKAMSGLKHGKGTVLVLVSLQ